MFSFGKDTTLTTCLIYGVQSNEMLARQLVKQDRKRFIERPP